MAIFAFTNGYFLASSVVIGAAQANDEEKETAGFLLAFG